MTTTSKTYKTMLDSIRKGLNKNTRHDFLLDYDEVVNWLETNPTRKTKKPLTKASLKTYYSMIKATLRDLKDPRFDEVMKKYDAKMIEYAAIQREQDEKQELSISETKKWTCWSCIDGLRDKLLTDYNDNNDWRTYQEYLIVCLYTLMPPQRLDYSPMRFIGEVPVDDNKQENYCVLLADKAVFILNAYKTAYTMKNGKLCHHQNTFDAPPLLFKVLEKWRTINKSEFLIVKKNTPLLPMSSHELGQTITRLFERETGIPATLNIIRHAYVSNMRQDEMPLLEKQRLAKQMSHSVDMAEKYRRINIKKDD
jgi:hypothetical protein